MKVILHISVHICEYTHKKKIMVSVIAESVFCAFTVLIDIVQLNSSVA